MPTLRAKFSFDDAQLGKVKRRQSFDMTETAANRYVDAGLLEYADENENSAPATDKQPATKKKGSAKQAKAASTNE